MDEATGAGSTTLKRHLREHFGFHPFLPGQERVVQAAIEDRDIIVIMPTGSGKSLCFQSPALVKEGTTVVVSPVNALFKDQTNALRERGLSVAAVNSTITGREERDALEAIAAGRKEFVYTTPERLDDLEFRAVLKRTKIDLFVVDEAHGVSHWGHDFCPEFLFLADVIDDLGRPPVLALTATATEDAVDDIRDQFRIHDAEVVHTGCYRPNLRRRRSGSRGMSPSGPSCAGSLAPPRPILGPPPRRFESIGGKGRAGLET